MVMRHARILNLFISSISPVSLPIQKSLTTCVGCGRFQLQLKFPYTTITPVKKHFSPHPKIRPAEPSVAITKLVKQDRTSEALAAYLDVVSKGGMPSRESLYQLTRSLYKSSHLHGLYAIHDTLLSRLHHQKPSKRSNRSKRTLLYLNTMLINLMGSYTRPVDMVRIKALCKELNQFQCSNQSPIVLYNTLIKIMLQQQQTASAHALLDDLYARHLQPTMQTYGILMKDAAMRKDKSRLLSYLDQIDKNPDLGIDYATVSIVVGALCRCRAFDRAVHVVKALHLPRTKDEISSPKYTQHLLEWIEKRKQYSQKKNRKKKKKDIKRK